MNSNMEKDKDLGNLIKVMGMSMKESGLMVNSKEEEFIIGEMEEFIKENLKILCLMGKD